MHNDETIWIIAVCLMIFFCVAMIGAIAIITMPKSAPEKGIEIPNNVDPAGVGVNIGHSIHPSLHELRKHKSL